MVQWRKSWGKLVVHPRDRAIWPQPLWVVLHVEDDLGRYLFAQAQEIVKCWYKLQMPVWDGHVSIVRGEIEAQPGAVYPFDGEEVDFYYDPEIYQAGGHFCVDVQTDHITRVRSEVGLPAEMPIPPHLSFGVVLQPSPHYDLSHLLPRRGTGDQKTS